VKQPKFSELEDDLRENILSRLSPKEIAEELDELKPMMPLIIAELSQDLPKYLSFRM
jgi:magnesium transporter